MPLPPISVGLVHGRQAGIALDPGGITKHDSDQQGRQHDPTEKTIAQAREQRQVGKALGDTDRKRVEDRARETHVRRDIDHAKTRNRVVSHRDGQRDDDDHEGQCLLAHPEYRPEQAEKDDHQRDDNIIHPNPPQKAITLEASRRPQEREDARVDRPAAVHYLKGATNNQEKSDDTRLLLEAVEQDTKHLPALWRLLHGMKRVIDNDRSLGAIHYPDLTGILARRNDPRQGRADQDNDRDDRIGMGNFPQSHKK